MPLLPVLPSFHLSCWNEMVTCRICTWSGPHRLYIWCDVCLLDHDDRFPKCVQISIIRRDSLSIVSACSDFDVVSLHSSVKPATAGLEAFDLQSDCNLEGSGHKKFIWCCSSLTSLPPKTLIPSDQSQLIGICHNTWQRFPCAPLLCTLSKLYLSHHSWTCLWSTENSLAVFCTLVLFSLPFYCKTEDMLKNENKWNCYPIATF